MLLEVNEVSKSFGATKALRNVNFDLVKGEIHSLVGENGAGKSTLMKILSGVHKKDTGKILLEGKEINPSKPIESQELGISTVFQELSLCGNLSVAENIFVNRVPSFFGMIKKRELHKITENYLNNFKISIKPDTLIQQLNLAQRQIIEVLKAISINAKILILDEPTSALEITEVEILFDLLNMLRKKGTGIIFITHKLKEVFDVSDRVTIFRDGELVCTKPCKETSSDEVITLMVGRSIVTKLKSVSSNQLENNDKLLTSPEQKPFKKVLLSVKNYSYSKHPNKINFDLYHGEILGFAGLTGAGRSELVQSLFGYRTKDSGEVFIEDRKVDIFNPMDAIKYGIMYSPEDRKEQGLFLKHSIMMNISVSCLDKVSDLGLMKKTKEMDLSNKYVKELAVKANSLNHSAENLSGGNQQKVLLAKCLAAQPKILIVDEPTRGIDIGSKMEIHKLLLKFTMEGGTIILISSDLLEIIGLSDRVLVFKEGSIIGEISEDISENSIMSMIFRK